jgi:RND superfamily putative drug exporter
LFPQVVAAAMLLEAIEEELTMNRFTRRIGAASARRPWPTVVAWAVVAAAVMALAGTVGGTLIDDLVAPGSQSERAMELL